MATLSDVVLTVRRSSAHDEDMHRRSPESRPTIPVPVDPQRAWRDAAARNAARRAQVAMRRSQAVTVPMADDDASERPTVRPSAA